jgi:hypothetical protein
MQYKFKPGDVIETTIKNRGFERATVVGVFKQTKGKNKGKMLYKLKIICGTATMPIEAESNYKLVKQ